MVRLPAVALPLLAAVLLAPLSLAHDALEAREVETLVLEDEADDVYYATGGYDVWHVFVGEAHLLEAGAGATGDGVYFRMPLYGGPGPAPTAMDEHRVVVTFEGPSGPVTRSLATTDGKTFEGDFDVLQVASKDGTVVVERAFVALASAGLERGEAIGGFVVESFVGDDLRDRAPGGVFAPGTKGLVEAPSDSRTSAETLTLSGPTGYVVADVARDGDAFAITVTSLLRKGAQHAHLAIPDETPGWTIAPVGESAANLPATKSVTFRVRATPSGSGPIAPIALDVTTDLGGRVGLVTAIVDGAPAIVKEGVPVATASASSGTLGAPALATLGAIATVAAAALGAARARR